MSKLGVFAVGGILISFASSSFAETFFVDCNRHGFEQSADNRAISDADLQRNRETNSGLGNGGESLDLTLNVETGDLTVTCVSTETEETPGILRVVLSDGTVLLEIPSPVGEGDPGKLTL